MNKSLFNPVITFRRATLDDFPSIYEILMQDHINPFMSFEQISIEEFRPIFNTLFKSSDIYVIEENNRVVATRRIIFDSGPRSHVAYFASFGVHKDYLSRGYGQLFYDRFLEILQQKHPHITRIELGQETDNPSGALHIAQKKGFRICAIAPEWQPRATGPVCYTRKWLVAERFLEKFPHPETAQHAQDCLTFITPTLPTLNHVVSQLEPVNVNIPCTVSDGVRRFKHIQFWDIDLQSPLNNPAAAQMMFRNLAVKAAKQGFKKIELLTHNPQIISLMHDLGFHCRGKKTASYQQNGTYYNEAFLDFSFYNLNDAKEVVTRTMQDVDHAKIIAALEQCQQKLQHVHSQGLVDDYGQYYMANLGFQMTREVLSEGLYNNQNAPWGHLIQQLPEELTALKHALQQLADSLNLNISAKPSVVAVSNVS